jgi:hypothetical protein
MQRSANPLAAARLPVALALMMIAAVTVLLWKPWSKEAGLGGVEGSGTPSTVEASTGDSSAENQGGSTDDGTKGDRRGGFRFATELHRNLAGGYMFRYPAEWELDKDQTVSRLMSPDGHVVVSFGLGPVGGLPVAYDEFVALLDDSYNDVAVRKVDATKVGGNVGVLLRGGATTSTGVRVHFLAVVIERKNEQRAIGALAATDFGAASFPPPVREILKSFRPL